MCPAKIIPRTLLCLDFDLTLTQTHLFRYVVDTIHGGFSREEALLRAIKVLDQQGPRGGIVLWQTLAIWLNHGHGLVVTSYTAFPELPIALLSRGIASLREYGARSQTRWLSRPLIVYGDPAPHLNPSIPIPNTILVSQQSQDLSHQGKNSHITEALKYLMTQGQHFERVLLVDDDPNNIEYAQKIGHDTIQVDSELESISHLIDLQSYLGIDHI